MNLGPLIVKGLQSTYNSFRSFEVGWTQPFPAGRTSGPLQCDVVGVSNWSYTSVGHGEASELGKKSLTANISVNMNPGTHRNSFLESLNHVVFNDVVVKLLSCFFHLQIGHIILSCFTSCENADLKISIFTYLMIQRFFNIDYYWLLSAMVERIKIVVNSQSLLNIVFCHVLEYKFFIIFSFYSLNKTKHILLEAQ